MRLKVLALGTGILVLLAAGAAALNWRLNAPQRAGRVGEPLLGAIDLASAERIEIVSNEATVTLRSRPDGSWVVEQQSGFDADGEKLSRVLVKMTGSDIAHKVTERPDKLADLGLLTPAENDGEREEGTTATDFAIYDPDGEPLYRVLLGNNRSGEGGPTTYGGQYVRFPGEQSAYLVQEALMLDEKPQDWIDKVVFDVDADETLQSIRVDAPGQPAYHFVRDEPGTPWRLQGREAPELSQKEVRTLANSLAALDVVKVAPEDADPEKLGRAEVGTVRMTWFDERHYEISIGAAKGPGDEFRYIAFNAGLADAVDDADLRREVKRFNARYQGRLFALHAYDAKRLQRPLNEFMVSEDGEGEQQ